MEANTPRELDMNDSATASPYGSLDPSNREIRLLRIDSITPTITCTMSTYSLDTVPGYFALSYMWGDATSKRKLKLNNCVVSITQSLAQALEAVHYQWDHGFATKVSSELRLLWADAICINQEDVEEKNHQIPLMKNIYMRALLGLAWLGPSDPTILEGFEAVELMVSRIRSLKPEERASPAWVKDVDFPVLYMALLELMAISYWRRAWILQELVLSHEVLFMCGQNRLRLRDLMLFQKWRTECRQDFLDARLRRPAYFDRELWRMITTIGYDTDGIIGTIVGLKLSVSVRKSLGNSDVDRIIGSMETDQYLRLQASSFGAFYQATDPKDHVYAFLALCRPNLVPDYSPLETVAQVYRKWIELLLEHPHYPREGAMCRLSFLDHAGIGYYREPIPGLPSWLPNFAGSTKATGDDVAHINTEFIKQRRFTLRFKRDTSNYIRTSTKLFCPAILLNGITHISPRLDGHMDDPGTAWVQWSLDRILHRQFEGPMFQHKITGPMLQHKIIGLGDCLLNRSKMLRDLPIYNYGQPRWTEAILGDERRRIKAALEECSAMNKDGDDRKQEKPTYDPFPQCDVWPLLKALLKAWDQVHPHHDHNMFDVMLALRFLPRYLFARDKVSEDSIMRDWPTAMASASGLCLAETSDGCIGLCPPKIQRGDIVAMLQGCTNPVVLRKIDKHYVFVGVSYFSVYMKETETMNKLLEQGKLKEKIIEIR